MATVVTATEFGDRRDLPDWRYLLASIEATFRTGSFGAGAQLITAIAAAADAAEHHPDLELRYPGTVHVALTTHGEGGLVTDLDLHLARTISAIATDLGATSAPTAARTLEIALDVTDAETVRPFWEAVLGLVGRADPVTGIVTELVDPSRHLPTLWFQQMDQPRPQRNRFHLDVTVAPEEAEPRVAAALAAGGTLVTDRHAPSFWVLADAEGNEVCVCTCQERD